MAGHQVVGIDFIFTFFMVFSENGHKFFIVFIKGEDIMLIDASYHDVIDFTFTFYSGYPLGISIPPTDSLLCQ